jgi:hypothetical protein
LCAVLSAALLFSKVLSPQYFIFLLCALVTAPAPTGRVVATGYWLLLAVIIAATAVIFPWEYPGLLALRPSIQVLVIFRNAALAMLTLCLFLRAWKSTRRRYPRHSLQFADQPVDRILTAAAKVTV